MCVVGSGSSALFLLFSFFLLILLGLGVHMTFRRHFSDFATHPLHVLSRIDRGELLGAMVVASLLDGSSRYGQA